MVIICFACSAEMPSMRIRAFDNNFCSNYCVKSTSLTNEYLDSSLINPYLWIQNVKEIDNIKNSIKKAKKNKNLDQLIYDNHFKHDASEN